MSYDNSKVSAVAELLEKRFDELQLKSDILKAPELRELYAQIPTMPAEERGAFGQAINRLKQDLEAKVASHQDQAESLPAIDVTAPMDVNSPAP
ncbi:hypothetical protein KDA23_02755, partial [Candidatus Saccharibacteria bacterium]|nr:hypothetical protein [Candidatus Saccharibacteria bacterium]